MAAAVCADPQVLLSQPLVHRPIISSPIISSLPVTSYIAGQPIVQVAEQKPVEEKEVEVESYSAEEPAKKIEIPTVYTSGVAGWPLAYNVAPVVQNLKVVPRYQAKNGEVEHTVFKREADPQLLAYNSWASPLIKPAVYSAAAVPAVYSSAALPAVASPVVYNAQVVNPLQGVVGAKTYANNFHPFTQGYAAKGQYVADSVGARHVAKRDADAQLLAYNNWAGVPLAYNNWASPLVRPAVYSAAAVPAVLPWTAKTVANDAIKPQQYAGKGQHIAVSAGAVHIAKRDAEADPAVLYSGLYNYAARPVISSYYRPSVYSSYVRPAVYGYSGLYNWY